MSTSRIPTPTRTTSRRTASPSRSSADASSCAAASTEAVEGKTRSRNVVIEFPSYEAALACWNSPEYKSAKAKRQGGAVADIIVIEGYDGAQPG